MARFVSLLLLFLMGIPPGLVRAESTEGGLRFDPQRHMRVAEVKIGMKGYGLSVFKGTKIERFDVEVLSVLKKFNPKYDVILVRCKGANLEHTGSIAGMSGSPIYLKDETGRERMVGAFAYGWPLMKDPVGGVQPIEYMLDIKPRKAPTTNSTTQPGGGGKNTARAQIAAPKRWLASDTMLLPGMKQPPQHFPFASSTSIKPNPRLTADDADTTKLRPLVTPLMTSGLPTRLLNEFEPIFKAYGLVALQSGGGIGAGSSSGGAAPKLEPGSVLAVPLLLGDVEMTAVGTTTEVQGPHVVGFGHPFNNEGPITLPIGSGEINAVIANLMTSFKLGALARTTGMLYADETVGVAGKIGEVAPMIPIDVKIEYTDGTGEKSYSFQGASHRRFTPLLTTAAVMAAVTGMHDLPEHHTLEYDLTVEFNNGEKVNVANTDVDTTAAAIFTAIGQPMLAASENPFKEVSVKRVDGIVRITPEARSAEILWASSPKLKYRPGETLKAFVNYRPFRSDESILPVEFDLPHDLPDGTYQFSLSGWEQYFAEEQMTKPFRFSAENAKEMFAVLRDISSVKHDALYMRLMRQPDGVAIGRTAMPSLPSSRREVLMGAGRSNTTPFISSVVKNIPMPLVMSGAAQLEITVEREDRVETASGKVTKEAPILPKPEDKPTTPRGPKPPEKPPEAPKPDTPGGEPGT